MHVLPTISYLATDACSYSAVVPAALTISFASGLVTTGYPHLSLVPIGVFHDLPSFSCFSISAILPDSTTTPPAPLCCVLTHATAGSGLYRHRRLVPVE